MNVFAVIDTNVIVSGLLSRKPDTATVRVLHAFQEGKIRLLYNEEILAEYYNVLSRPKFGLMVDEVISLVDFIKKEGIESTRVASSWHFPDRSDIVFYEIALSKDGAFLVTGNTKHFPSDPIVVTPAEMMTILEKG